MKSFSALLCALVCFTGPFPAERLISADGPILNPKVQGQSEVSTHHPETSPTYELTIGSPAPMLEASSWLNGQADYSFRRGQVYVIEFWATWCAPCLESMPHLSGLQEKLGAEVQVLAFTDESHRTIQRFLRTRTPNGEKWGDLMSFPIGIDKERSTYRRYLERSGDVGIPKSFLVGRDGYVEWIGHPTRLDGPLNDVIRGEWNREKALEQHTRFMRMAMLHQEGRTEELQAIQKEMVNDYWDDGIILMDLAASIANSQAPRDLDLAIRAAVRANALTKSQDATALRTLAWVHYERGDLDSAIKWQMMATKIKPDDHPLKTTLEWYLDKKQSNPDARKDEQ